MSSNDTLVKINFATDDEVSELHSVGKLLADRIIIERNENGYFSGPDDLSRVRGISENLAITLSPHIDWEIPCDKISNERGWFATALNIAIAISFIYMTVEKVSRVQFLITQYRLGNAEAGIWAWVNLSLLAFGIFVAVASLMYAIQTFTTSVATAKWIGRHIFYFWIPIVICAISCGIGNAIYYQFFSPNGWKELLLNPLALMGLSYFPVVSLLLIPQIAVLYSPSIAYNKYLAKVYDAGVIVYAIYELLIIYFFKSTIPIWITILHCIVGFLFAFAGINILRTGESFYKYALEILDPAELLRRRKEHSKWIKWLNTRLPEPQHQRALKKALDDAYPPSKLKSFIGFIVIVFGGWLIVSCLDSIVEWFVQGYLDKYFPLFFK